MFVSKFDGIKLPNWCDIPEVGFRFRGCQSDPELEYHDVRFNIHDVEDTMYGYFVEDVGSDDLYEFDRYIQENSQDVYDILNELIDAGYGERFQEEGGEDVID